MTNRLIDLDLLVKGAESLEPLPASAARLADIVTRDDWEIGEVAEVARLDEALTGRLLGAANSARSGARAEITSVEQAVVRLGPGATLSLAIGPSIKNLMKGDVFGLSEGSLWRHSVAAALAIDRARAYCVTPILPHAFAAALLHDVGKLVLARHLEPTAEAFLNRARQLGYDPQAAEEEVLAVNHAELGALVARSWKLPECIAAAIQHHHSPLAGLDEDTRRLCHQIALADAVTAAIGASSGPGSQPAFDGAIAGCLGITLADFEDLCCKVADELEDVLALYEA